MIYDHRLRHPLSTGWSRPLQSSAAPANEELDQGPTLSEMMR